MACGYQLFLLSFVVLLQLPLCAGGGRLFFGLIEYNNDDNRAADGRCCDGEEDVSGGCPLSCDLIVQMSIIGLDGPNTTHRRPSDVPFNSSAQFPFPTADQDLINPLTFTFDQWPDCLDMAVEIYDADDSSSEGGIAVLQLVDTMMLRVALATPSNFFTERTLVGERRPNPSSLKVVIRYDCDNGDSCPPESLPSDTTPLPENIMECPTSPPPTVPTSSTTPTPTPTPTTSLSTPTTPTTTTASTTTVMTSTKTSTTSLPSTTVTDVMSTTPSSTVRASASTSTSTSLPTTATSPKKTTETMTTPKNPTMTITPMRTMRTTPEEGSTVTSGLTPKTTREGNNGPMVYWPIILGVVLGVLIITAIVGFLVYSRRRKAAYKRQEFYTVTPRLMSMVEENGTAGRGDIPVETTEEEYKRQEIYTVTPRVISVSEDNDSAQATEF